MAYQPQGRVENYTDAFIATCGVLIFMTLWTVASLLGFIWVMVTAYGLDHLFRWIGRRRAA